MVNRQRTSVEGDDLNLAQSLYNLAVVLTKRREFSEAEIIHQPALVIRQKAAGSEGGMVANSLFGLGDLAELQGLHDLALRRFIESGALRRQSGGEPRLNRNLAAVLVRVGRLYLHQKKYTEARRALEEALDIELATVGNEHANFQEIKRLISEITGPH